MTAQESLTHPWLIGTGDTLKAIRADQQSGQQPPPSAAISQAVSQSVGNSSLAEESLLSLASNDVSMAPIATNGQAVPQNMSLDDHGTDGAAGSYSQFTSGSQNPTYRMPGAFHNGRHALQRRSRVIADAEANGRRLPEPSFEMLAQAASQTLQIGTSNQLKRKAETSRQNEESDSSLTPLPEEIEIENEDDEVMGVGSEQEQLSPVVRRSKRGRNSNSDPETPQRAGDKRRSAKNKRGRAIAEPIGEVDEAMRDSPARDGSILGLRRSPRNRNR
jgi:hypothetical protein